jgi:hypothetical protein
MATTAALHAVKHATSSPQRAWFYGKLVAAFFMPPLGVAMELHSVRA